MKRTYRLFGFEVLSIESDEETAEPELTAGDNGGELRSDRIDVPPLGFGMERIDGWEDRK